MKISTLFFLCFFITGFSENQNLVDTARKLLLSGKRAKAYELIVNKISTVNSSDQNQLLKKELHRLSTIFLTEDSQKLFEEGRTLYFSDNDDYIKKLNQSLALEPENLRILSQRAWFFLRNTKCNSAGKDLMTIKKLNPYARNIELLKFYLSVCKKKVQRDCSLALRDEGSDLSIKVYQLMSCLPSKEGKHQKKMVSLCHELKSTAGGLPEVDIWCSKEKSKAGNLAVYLKKCESLKKSSYLRKLIDAYPFVCQEQLSGQ